MDCSGDARVRAVRYVFRCRRYNHGVRIALAFSCLLPWVASASAIAQGYGGQALVITAPAAPGTFSTTGVVTMRSRCKTCCMTRAV